MTQTRKEALIELRDKVRAGTADDFGAVKPGWPIFRGYAESAYHGSLDAAKALHDAVLPGWALARLCDWPGCEASCEIWGTHEGKDGERWHHPTDGRANADAHTPARAWLLAIFEALIEQEPDT